MQNHPRYPKDTPFWSFMTLAVLGGVAFLGGRFVWRKIATAPERSPET